MSVHVNGGEVSYVLDCVDEGVFLLVPERVQIATIEIDESLKTFTGLEADAVESSGCRKSLGKARARLEYGGHIKTQRRLSAVRWSDLLGSFWFFSISQFHSDSTGITRTMKEPEHNNLVVFYHEINSVREPPE